MVVTCLMLKSLENFDTSFSYLYPCPLEWDKKSGKLVCNKVSKKLIPWILSVFGGMGSVFIFCVVLLGCQLFGVARLEFSNIVLTMVFLCLVTYAISLEILYLFYAEDCSHSSHDCVAQVKKIEFGQIFTEFQLDPLWIILNLTVAMFAIFPYFMYPFIAYFGLDPFTQTLHNLLIPSNLAPPPVTYALSALRFSVVAPLVKRNRILSFYAVTTTLATHLILTLISNLSKATEKLYMTRISRSAIDTYLARYQTLQVIMTATAEFTAPRTAIFMFLGIILSVLMNFVTLKMHGIVPLPFFAFFPIASVLVVVLIGVMLPMLVDVYENCGEMYARWKYLVGRSVDKKYLRRRLKAMRMLQFYGGINGYNICMCKRWTKLWYYGVILS
ncbi:putative acyl carrier protein, mitochondrial [Folsomia candida]|uniref:Putative acyl carrier protein, mitochondrial n=1 Tax=Folsomia candida TaxID=158441 RepID=A0A226ECV5_FOLCA|nr:putative acyl carrier protein, mitochondrial [Folsomia candida]